MIGQLKGRSLLVMIPIIDMHELLFIKKCITYTTIRNIMNKNVSMECKKIRITDILSSSSTCS